MPTEYIGPFEERYFRILVDERLVPNIKARKIDDQTWTLTLDERFAIDVKDEEIQTWMWFVANAMAIAAGFDHFGEGSVRINRYDVRITGLSVDEFEELKTH